MLALDSSFTAIEFFHGKLCLILSVLEKMTCSQQANLTEKDLDREILYCKKKRKCFQMVCFLLNVFLQSKNVGLYYCYCGQEKCQFCIIPSI